MSKEQVLRKEKEMIDQAFERLLKDYMASPHGKKEDIIRNIATIRFFCTKS
jgi:hypothetical protein